MNKSNLIKVFSILVISVVMTLIFSVTVNATDLTGNIMSDLTGNNGNATANANTAGTNTLTPTNTAGNTLGTTNTANTTGNLARTNSTSNIANTTNNTTTTGSTYGNNTSLPDTGIGSSLPIVLLIVVFGISSVFAYKKVNDYKNI